MTICVNPQARYSKAQSMTHRWKSELPPSPPSSKMSSIETIKPQPLAIPDNDSTAITIVSKWISLDPPTTKTPTKPKIKSSPKKVMVHLSVIPSLKDSKRNTLDSQVLDLTIPKKVYWAEAKDPILWPFWVANFKAMSCLKLNCKNQNIFQVQECMNWK